MLQSEAPRRTRPVFIPGTLVGQRNDGRIRVGKTTLPALPWLPKNVRFSWCLVPKDNCYPTHDTLRICLMIDDASLKLRRPHACAKPCIGIPWKYQ
ncbi:hypothetical protein PoB_003573500 [Plakobranchus ocellatus]|uniref:Uncharacterized protein n=1 Tax=Plakobranchus ocellatus TaxID=259542 RepID=A0AAV4APF0_9GAST|nr:hypothetical protein PoB_003573500 [Plakobranchus ocellatus]